jgi:hypothetical protein
MYQLKVTHVDVKKLSEEENKIKGGFKKNNRKRKSTI